MKHYVGRCFVEITLPNIDSLIKALPIKIYFKNYKTAKRFSYYWTKRKGYFVRIFEYHLPDYFNDFQLGFDWVESWEDGKSVASNQYPYWKRSKDKLSNMYGIMENNNG